MIRTLSFLALSLCCADLQAAGCAAKAQKVVKQQVVVKEQVIVPVAVQAVVPLYSFSYAAPAAQVYQPPAMQQQVTPPQPQAVVEPPCDLCAELRLLREEIARLRGAPVGVQPLPSPENGAALLHRKCASCHGAAVAEAKGGGFALFDAMGGLAPLTLAEKRRVLARTAKGEMPPRGHPPLTPEEMKVLEAFLK